MMVFLLHDVKQCESVKLTYFHESENSIKEISVSEISARFNVQMFPYFFRFSEVDQKKT